MKKLLIIIFILFFAAKLSALGVGVYVNPPPSIAPGQIFELPVYMNTNGDLINTVEASIVFDSSIFDFKGYREGGGTITFWVEAPKEIEGKVHFAGVIPGGVSDTYDASQVGGRKDILLVKLLFQTKKEGSAVFSVVDSVLYKHDGRGTEVKSDEASNTSPTIVIQKGVEKQSAEPLEDENPPTAPVLNIIKSSLFSRTPQMIEFYANDRDSGIQKYEVKIGIGKWMETTNPIPVKSGLFPKTVKVRAYDFNGNYSESEINVPGSLPIQIGSVVLLFVVAFVWLYKLIK